ncbi:hypothetical protein FRC20_011526, partial [Serendipita sp. 405]
DVLVQEEGTVGWFRGAPGCYTREYETTLMRTVRCYPCLMNFTRTIHHIAVEFTLWIYPVAEQKIPRLTELSIYVPDEHMLQFQQEFDRRSEKDISSSRFPPSLRSLRIPSGRWIFLAGYVSTLDYLVVGSDSDGNDVIPLESCIQKLGTTHPDLRKLHCTVSSVTGSIRGKCDKYLGFTTNWLIEIALYPPNLKEIGFADISLDYRTISSITVGIIHLILE